METQLKKFLPSQSYSKLGYDEHWRVCFMLENFKARGIELA